MTKALLTLTWKTGCRIIRIVPVLADSGAFVAGVLALLSQFQLNLALGIILVVLGLVGIDALVKRLERSKTLNSEQDARHPIVPGEDTALRMLPASQESNQCQLRTTMGEEQIFQVKTDHLLEVNVSGEKYELRVSLRQRLLNTGIGESDSPGV